MKNQKLRVAVYARVSTDRDDQTNSLTSQRNYFAEFITNHNDWELSEVYYEMKIA